MNIFVTGATGYIGGAVAMALLEAGHQVTGLVRSETGAARVQALGIKPLMGSLDDLTVLADAARAADAVVNAANADNRAAAEAMLEALRGTNKRFIHTSGSSVIGTRARGEATDDVFDETTPFEPSAARVARAALNRDILASTSQGVHPVIVCPSLIYGRGAGVKTHSMQVPWLIDLARSRGVPAHVGPGENIWSHVHIDDLTRLYLLALEAAPAGAFYFAEHGEASMRSVCVAIGQMLGQSDAPEPMTATEAAAVWGEGPANDTMASNSRVRAERARKELNWQPSGPALLDEILTGCYAQDYRG